MAKSMDRTSGVAGATLEHGPGAASPQRRVATFAGLGAIGLWALLAPLGVAVGPVPPFQLTAAAFLVGGLAGLAVQVLRGRSLRAALTAEPAAAVLTITALFGFHACYFTALRLLPAVTALLVVNLWPLLIVLLSALLPGERLRARHLTGAFCGLAGTVLVVTANGAPSLGGAAPGWAAALAAALIWSGYSVLNRRVGRDARTESMTGYCLITAVLASVAALLLEPLAAPVGWGWVALLALGLGPVGLAFFLWDHGTRHGDLRALGASAYLGPLLGAVLLVVMGEGEPSWRLVLAALLIIGGAALASGDLWRSRAPA